MHWRSPWHDDTELNLVQEELELMNQAHLLNVVWRHNLHFVDLLSEIQVTSEDLAFAEPLRQAGKISEALPVALLKTQNCALCQPSAKKASFSL